MFECIICLFGLIDLTFNLLVLDWINYWTQNDEEEDRQQMTHKQQEQEKDGGPRMVIQHAADQGIPVAY